MSNLPFRLPECSRPATTRVDLYTPAPDGSNSSLDAVVYACDQHDSDVVAAAWSVDMNALRVVIAPDIERDCGHAHVFPTGNLGGAR